MFSVQYGNIPMLHMSNYWEDIATLILIHEATIIHYVISDLTS